MRKNSSTDRINTVNAVKNVFMHACVNCGHWTKENCKCPSRL